ncbi:uncharacterized protein A1O9_05944 [Exophiala aquamarina CBS 119918]|uniref:Zona occludens toxin N-terminal domain-containing protein n=1 Tax=Exophiala aquamarina CBS 119918 TaxID=1182545 RepID=A0A072PDS7_9EURO|nr:uncharacterized protein A1O9_05944 [Exophiala aquamarina CBS 119918]KEF58021.1 hypothetical protein A1O9_05944 [Exophiala aquamarina CBS 119918]
MATPPTEETDSKTQEFLQLLHGSSREGHEGFNSATSLGNDGKLQEVKTTPLFSNQVRLALTPEKMMLLGSLDQVAFPQYGLLGVRQQSYGADQLDARFLPVEHNLIMANMNAPWSAFICGSQGGGKSHTLSCLLENSLLPSSLANVNPKPLAGLVFHFDHFTSAETTQLCEAAYLCSSGVPVRVLVSPSNYAVMHTLYSNLPGLPSGSPKPQVVPLYLKEEQLNVSRMMTLMAMNDNEHPPLYMEVLRKILRDMAMEGSGRRGVNYRDFTSRMGRQGFSGQQNGPLNLRLQLLESFLADEVQDRESSTLLDDIFKSSQGTLTIVDLSCPFVNENDACALFAICLSIFMEHRADCGRIVAIDEAHKFLTKTGEAQRLTEQLISLIRQQRHLATRVVIATQEPTLSSKLIDLCNVCIVHRFNSPAWFQILEKHLAGASNMRDDKDADTSRLFEMIVALRTGEAFVFCPTALLDLHNGKLFQLETGFIRVKIRARCSTDGGRSVMAEDRHSVGSVDYRPVSTIIRPYRSSRTATTARRERRRSASPVRAPTAPRPMQRVNVVQTVPPSKQSRASDATLPVAVPTTTEPAGSSTTHLPQPQVDQARALEFVRRTASQWLRSSPHTFTHDRVRMRVIGDLSLPPAFFDGPYWLNLSREAIRTEVAKFRKTNATRLPGYN